MSGITLKQVADTTIPTPATDKFTLFFDSADSEPKYKDDAGTVTPLTGPAGQGVPTGGTTGQVLAKIDATNYNTQWVSAATGDVVGPASATADAVALYNGSTGKLLKDGVTVAQIKQIEQNSQSAAYTLVLADAGKHIYHPSADATARVWTIPANSSVAFPIGTAVTFVNDSSAGIITLAITSDTLVWLPTGGTGSRSLSANGSATALKVTSTRWILTGVGLS